MPTARLVATDTKRLGNWSPLYGSEGWQAPGIDQAATQWVVDIDAGSPNVWARETNDERALVIPGRDCRYIACWYGYPTFTMSFTPPDATPRQLVLYCVDWDRMGRRQRFKVLDATTNTELMTHELADFGDGHNLLWEISGAIRMEITSMDARKTSVVSGVYMSGMPAAAQVLPTLTLAHSSSSSAPTDDSPFVAPNGTTFSAGSGDGRVMVAGAGGPGDQHRDLADREAFGEREDREAFGIGGDRPATRPHAMACASQHRAQRHIACGVGIGDGKAAGAKALQLALGAACQRDGWCATLGQVFVGRGQPDRPGAGQRRDDRAGTLHHGRMVASGFGGKL